MSEYAPRTDDQMIDVHTLLQANNAARNELRAQAELDTKAARQEAWIGDQGTEGKSDRELAAQANTVLSYADYAKKGPQSDEDVWQARFEHFDKSGGEQLEAKGANELLADYARALVHQDRTLKEDVLGEVHRRASLKEGKEQIDYLKAYDKRFTGVIDKIEKSDDPAAALATYEKKAEEARKRRQAKETTRTTAKPESMRAAKVEAEPIAPASPVKQPTVDETSASSTDIAPAEQPAAEAVTPEPAVQEPFISEPKAASVSATPEVSPEADLEEQFMKFLEGLSDDEQTAIRNLAQYVTNLNDGDVLRTNLVYQLPAFRDHLSKEAYLKVLGMWEKMGRIVSEPWYVHDDGTTPKAYRKSFIPTVEAPTTETPPEDAGQADTQTAELAQEAAEPENKRMSPKGLKGVGKRALQRFRDAGYYIPEEYGEDGYVRPGFLTRAKKFGKPESDAKVAGAALLARESMLRDRQARFDAMLREDKTLRLVRSDDSEGPKLSERAYEKRLRQLTKSYMQEQRQASLVDFDPADYTLQHAHAVNEKIEAEEGVKTKRRRAVGRIALARRGQSSQKREGTENIESINELLQ